MFSSIIAKSSHKRVFIAFGHLHASLLINAGVDIVAVSNSLGHSNVSTTLNIYSHAFNDMKSKTCAAISESLKLK